MSTTQALSLREKRLVQVSEELAEEARKWDKPPEEAKPASSRIAETKLRSVRFDLD